MRKSLLGMILALGGFAAPTPALAADYAPPPPAYYPMPVQPSCCCPTVRRGLWVSPSACGANVYYQPAYDPAYQPGYAPEVGVEFRTRPPRKHCWRHHGHWVCR